MDLSLGLVSGKSLYFVNQGKLQEAIDIIIEFMHESAYQRLSSPDLDLTVDRAREFLKNLEE